MRRILITALRGALAGAILTAAVFMVAALLDGTGFEEAAFYSLIVAFFGAFLGGLVGTAVGAGNLGPAGGALAGLLVSLAVAAFYVLAFGSTGRYGYFLSASRVFIIVLAVPLMLTGMISAWLKNHFRGV